MFSSKTLRWASVIIVLLALLLIRSYRSSSLGTQSDEGLHITAAARVASGDVLYRDLFENRTPLVEWGLALFFKVATPNVFVGRVLAQLTGILSAALIIAAVNNANKDKVEIFPKSRSAKWLGSLLAVLFLAFTPLAIFWSRFTMLEHWQVLFSLLSITAITFALNSKNEIWWLIAGLSAGAALLSKQTALTLIAATLIFYLLLFIKERDVGIVRSIVIWLAGLATIVIAFHIILALNGSLSNFYEFAFTTDRFSPFTNLPDKIGSLLNWSFRQPFLPFALLGVLAILASGVSGLTLFLLWAGAEVGALFVPPQLDVGWGGFSHYTVNAIFALTLLTGIGIYWLWKSRNRQFARLITIFVILGVIFTIPAWFEDFVFAVQESNYPQPDNGAETEISNAISAINVDNKPILVLANAIFYQLSASEPSNLFFHYPEFLAQSELSSWSESDIVQALENDQLGTVAVSRVHLEDRLTEPIKAALWSYWEPMELYSYPYQRDIFLFTRKSDSSGDQQQPLSRFENGIELLDVIDQRLSNGDLLIRLLWRTSQATDQNLTVFVHLEDILGEMINQDDNIPSVGFRPTNSWQVGETIVDWHTIKSNNDAVGSGVRLRIGLYDSVSNERVGLSGPNSSEHSYVWDLKD